MSEVPHRRDTCMCLSRKHDILCHSLGELHAWGALWLKAVAGEEF